MAAVDPGSTNLGCARRRRAARGRRVRQLVRRHPPGVRLLRRAPARVRQLAIYEPGFLQCVAHLPPRRPPARGRDGEALLRRRVGHVGPRPRRHLRAAAHRHALARLPRHARGHRPARGRCRCGAATSWPRRWPASPSSAAATSTSASRSTSIPTPSPPTSSWSSRRWRWRRRSGRRSRPPPTRSGCWSCRVRQRAQEAQQRRVDLLGLLLLDPVTGARDPDRVAEVGHRCSASRAPPPGSGRRWSRTRRR